jgi:hypothetical protein
VVAGPHGTLLKGAVHWIKWGRGEERELGIDGLKKERVKEKRKCVVVGRETHFSLI